MIRQGCWTIRAAAFVHLGGAIAAVGNFGSLRGIGAGVVHFGSVVGCVLVRIRYRLSGVSVSRRRATAAT